MSVTRVYDRLSMYPITWDNRSQAWELHDLISGEIIMFRTERDAINARALVMTLPGSYVPMDAPGRVI